MDASAACTTSHVPGLMWLYILVTLHPAGWVTVQNVVTLTVPPAQASEVRSAKPFALATIVHDAAPVAVSTMSQSDPPPVAYAAL